MTHATNYPATTQRPCKLCGRDILLAKNSEDKPIALDLDSVCYIIHDDKALTVLAYPDHARLCRGKPNGDQASAGPGTPINRADK